MREYNLQDPLDMIRCAARERFAWPGGYEICIITKDGGLLCSKCVKENYREIIYDTKNGFYCGWTVEGITNDSNFDYDECSHCNKALGVSAEDGPIG